MSRIFRINFFILIFFILSLHSIKSESEIKTLPGKRLKTQEEISEYLKKNDLTTLVFFYRKESDKSNQVAENLKIVYSKLQYLIEYILVDCDDNNMEKCKVNDA